MGTEGKTRIQITVSDLVLKRLDDYCAKTGMTRSTYISYILATSLQGSEELMQAAADSIRESAKQ